MSCSVELSSDAWLRFCYVPRFPPALKFLKGKIPKAWLLCQEQWHKCPQEGDSFFLFRHGAGLQSSEMVKKQVTKKSWWFVWSLSYHTERWIKSCVSFNINRRVSGPLFSETEAFPRPGREDTSWAWGQDAWRKTTFNTLLLCCEIQQEIILECMPLAQLNVSVWRQGCSNCSTVWQQLYYIKDAF